MPTQRPVGFSPAEISGLVNRDVLQQHVDEAAFLWTIRKRATGEPHFTLKDLAALDERVEAHVDGLRVAGDVGWTACELAAAAGGTGAVFAASVIAFDAGQRDWMRAALGAALAAPGGRSEIVSALGWLQLDRVLQWMQLLLAAKGAEHRQIAVAAYAVHEHDPGVALAAAVDDQDDELRRRAIRAAGELKRFDLRGAVRKHLHATDEEARFWAAWSLVLLGVREAIPVLVDVAERGGESRDAALQLALRAMQLDESRRWIRSLAQQPDRFRIAVMGAGFVGDPASVPWLIAKMEVPELAKLAGEAFSMITGADLSYDDLEVAAAPADGEIDEGLDLDYESNLRTPSPALVAAWWEKHRSSFAQGRRYLAGRPIERAALLEVLVTGRQRQRAAAALELALLDQDQRLFQVRAPGWRQQLRLSRWTS